MMSQCEEEELKNEQTSYSITGQKRPHSPNSNLNEEPTSKRQKTMWDQLMNSNNQNGKKKKSKQKKKSKLPKVIKDKIWKIVENKFMHLPNDKKQLLLNPAIQQSPQQFTTMTGMLGFEVKEQSTLRALLSSHLSDVAIQNKSVQDIIFEAKAPEYFARAIKQQWNHESYSVLTAQKRCILVQLNDAKVSLIILKKITTVTNPLLAGMRKMAHVRDVLVLPSVKQKNNQLNSIEATLNSITNSTSTNKEREKKLLCDSLLKIKHILSVAISELIDEINNIELMLIKLRIVSFEDGIRKHLHDIAFDKTLVPRSPGLLRVVDGVLKQLIELKNDIKTKRDALKKIIDEKKIKKFQTRASQMTNSREKDRKRKEKRKADEQHNNNNNNNSNNANNALPVATQGLIIGSDD